MSKTPTTVTHFRKRCIGCGACTLWCPNYWELSEEDGKAVLKEAVEKKQGVYGRKLHPEDIEENKRAEECCPVRIIKVE